MIGPHLAGWGRGPGPVGWGGAALLELQQHRVSRHSGLRGPRRQAGWEWGGGGEGQTAQREV